MNFISNNRAKSILVLGLLLLPEAFALFAILPTGEAQTDPPPFGEGIWIINDKTLLTDRTVRLNGSIVINNGASLTLENSTLMLKMRGEFYNRIRVLSGGGFYIYNNSYLGAFDAGYCVYYEPGSFGIIRNSTIANHNGLIIGTRNDIIVEDSKISAGYYGMVMWGGRAILRNVTLNQNIIGIWNVYGDLEVYRSTFDGDATALEFTPVCGDIFGSRLALWAPSWFGPLGDRCFGPRNGIIDGNFFARSMFRAFMVWSSTVTIRNNQITESAGYGLMVYTSIVYVENNIFSNLSKGINIEPMQGSWSQVYLKNNDVFDCYNYGVQWSDFAGLTGTWTVDRPIHINSVVNTRTPITVKAGGYLHVYNTTLGMLSTSASPIGLTIDAGGTALLDNVWYGPTGALGDQIYMQIIGNGALAVRNSTLSKVGYAWGVKGELGGVYSEGLTTIDGSYVGGGMYGVISNGGTTIIRDTIIDQASYGLFAASGKIEAYDSELKAISVRDVFATQGEADLYNITFNKMRYTVEPGGTMMVYWRCDLASVWQNGEPIGNVSFNISEQAGTIVSSGTTGQDGLSGPFFLREFLDTSSGPLMTTPHKVIGHQLELNLWNTTNISVVQNTRLMFYLHDNITPSLNVTSPGLIVYQMNNTLNVNGTALDRESGLDRVEWSFDLDLWYLANGLDKWNFTVVLPYGTKIIYIRAVDKAGNENILTLVATIDKDPPYLILMSPHDGFVTSLKTVLVDGFAEMGSTVSTRSVSVVSIDGSFRMSVPLDEGQNDLVVTATAPSGLKNSTMVRVIRDTTAPPIIITSPKQDYVTNKTTDKVLPVIGRTEPGAKFYFNGKPLNLNPDGNFTITVDLKEGLNILNFVATDDVGNQNTSILRIVYDIVAPTLSVYAPIKDLYTNKTTVHVSGLTEPLLNVTAKTGNFTVSTDANREGRFELDVGLTEGANTLTVTVRDKASNIQQDVRKVFRDTTPPQITLNSITDGMIVDTARVFLEGQTEPGAKVKVNGELLEPGYTGQFSKWLDLPSAKNPVVVEAIDKAGNRNTLTVHVNRKAISGPGGLDVQSGPDYFPWIAALVIAIVVVQLVIYVRYSLKKAKKQISSSTVKPRTGQGTPLHKEVGSDRRVTARRTPQQHPTRPAETGPEGEPEFDIEYGDGASNRPGGGPR